MIIPIIIGSFLIFLGLWKENDFHVYEHDNAKRGGQGNQDLGNGEQGKKIREQIGELNKETALL